MDTISYGVLYLIQNMIGQGIYIGQTTMRPMQRWHTHKNGLRRNAHDNPYLQHAWNKYGESAFEFIVLEEYTSLEALNEAESFAIAYFRYIGARLYNLREGGGSGGRLTYEARKRRKGRKLSESVIAQLRARKLTDEHKERLRQANIGRKHSPEAIAKMRQARVGFRHSDETRRRISELKRGQTLPESERQKRRGYRHTDEAKARIGAAHRGQQRPEEWKQHMRGITRSDATRQRLSDAAVRRNGRTYRFISPEGEIIVTHNMKAFAQAHNLSPACVSDLVRGRQKQHRGWTFLDEGSL